MRGFWLQKRRISSHADTELGGILNRGGAKT